MKNLLQNIKTMCKAFSSVPSTPRELSLLMAHTNARWMDCSYDQFAKEGYCQNVVAYRAIELVASAAASIDWRLKRRVGRKWDILDTHPLLELLHHPGPTSAGASFFHAVYAYYLLHGNSFIHIIRNKEQQPVRLHVLRPDAVMMIKSEKSGELRGYRYQHHGKEVTVPCRVGESGAEMIHLRRFHPLDDWYGLSPMMPASYSIDQHNEAAKWNQSLLQNAARPSGIFKVNPGLHAALSAEALNALKIQIDSAYSGSQAAGRPLLLSGGLEWQDTSMTNKDMDFLEAKHSAARDIALAFGVPPQLLGIPGDNSYNNMQEARLALWEQTIIPLIDMTVDLLNHALVPLYREPLRLCYDKETINALAPRRDQLWARVTGCDFMSESEKRAAVGLSTHKGE